jgi:hypothetical protein
MQRPRSLDVGWGFYRTDRTSICFYPSGVKVWTTGIFPIKKPPVEAAFSVHEFIVRVKVYCLLFASAFGAASGFETEIFISSDFSS